MPTQRVFVLGVVAPQEESAQREVFGLQSVAPARQKVEHLIGAVELGKARFAECGVHDAANGPRLVLLRSVHVAFGNVEDVVCVFGPAGLRHAATGFAQYRYPLTVDKVVDDNDAELAQGVEAGLGCTLAGPLWFEINKSRCALGRFGGS